MASLCCNVTQISSFLANKSVSGSPSRSPLRSAVALPRFQKNGIVCRAQKSESEKKNCLPSLAAPLMAAATFSVSNSNAFALVDERMSTEGTGLGLGLSNPLLGWILLGVFGLIWTVYLTTYQGVADDEDSGLSL
ncbi:hypothetical protein SUGI_0748080 [Cryptomeria japonica]|uniref:photosystem II reaction center W protein, chloroplastic n=1 Tax=Cryptomeria japonica TaxID=3369 RepID=UPI0024147FF8|nr:photosystem II reaction center W protein, chloroplastic [Cryptomeria japonica]GLJ36963.1 hypothetical protein SUGI_0748080 [Cryptomeria japonica]